MLTLLKNIERFNKRYNKKRGSAMLMVLMTMAIIIVVGTSMLFVTLSSFSNSIADTQQERAYNAALVMTETLKSSSYLGKLIESNSFELEQDNPVKLQFDNGDLDEELDDFAYPSCSALSLCKQPLFVFSIIISHSSFPSHTQDSY